MEEVCLILTEVVLGERDPAQAEVWVDVIPTKKVSRKIANPVGEEEDEADNGVLISETQLCEKPGVSLNA